MQLFVFVVMLVGGLLFASTSQLSAADPTPRPNVVYILLDNLGQEWLGCYGSEEGRTPNIDALARSGVRFEHCYTPPVCGPSRTVLLTGRYLLRSGFTLHHDAGLYGGGGLDPAREVTFARIFRDAGYATAISGKWQINDLYHEPDILKRHGFDEHLVWPDAVDRDRMTPEDWQKFEAAIQNADVETTVHYIQRVESRYWDPVVIRNGQREVHRGKYGPDLYQQFALDFIERHRDGPFLLYYPMVLTHGQTFTQPVIPTPANRQDGRPHHEMFGDMVAYADRLIGELVARLDQLGLRERTIVYVATDNGTESSLSARFRGREVKGGLYQLTEAGSDVAMLVNSPKLIAGGRTIPLTDTSDVLPTLCDLSGIAVPSNLVIDGRSQAAALRDPSAKPRREWIFNQYHNRRAVRDVRYKLYSTGEFYDVETDRDEQHNVAASTMPEIVATRSKLAKVLASMPPDAPPPFELRSQSAFRLKQAAREAGK